MMIKFNDLKMGTAVCAFALLAMTACAAPAEPAAESARLPTLAATSVSLVEAAGLPTAEVVASPTLEEAVRPFSTLPDLGEAPEIRNEVWINADAPVTLAESRGKVVLLEFWTFG